MTVFLLAAALAAVLRYLADFYLPRYGILIVNIIGSFIAGVILTLAAILQIHETVVQVVFGGFAGSLTTYSTVAILAAEQRGNRTGSATRTWFAHVGLSIVACVCGVMLTRLVSM
ncbi:fluoride efflux transporter FluC [Enteractinococcus helveticum]|uniref:Fluoride-specific ion channel n=1 Tax=Enteractinococcus helveticum TaxID=1837282 RepID=A0A1B7M1T5_9MICC|nr:CrcB family protein [Enteractinococcus helveticum]OAV62567.1 hypothetical protein A6F49_06420 [Enteractinococcus helveticum]